MEGEGGGGLVGAEERIISKVVRKEGREVVWAPQAL